jgi:hypothetical protein
LLSQPSYSAPRLTVKLNSRDENDVNDDIDDDNDGDDDYYHDNEQGPSSEADKNSVSFFLPHFIKNHFNIIP